MKPYIRYGFLFCEGVATLTEDADTSELTGDLPDIMSVRLAVNINDIEAIYEQPDKYITVTLNGLDQTLHITFEQIEKLFKQLELNKTFLTNNGN